MHGCIGLRKMARKSIRINIYNYWSLHYYLQGAGGLVAAIKKIKSCPDQFAQNAPKRYTLTSKPRDLLASITKLVWNAQLAQSVWRRLIWLKILVCHTASHAIKKILELKDLDVGWSAPQKAGLHQLRVQPRGISHPRHHHLKRHLWCHKEMHAPNVLKLFISQNR